MQLARVHIPVAALLGVSFTACKDETDPIVGDWKVIEVGGEAIPAEYADEYNIQMHIEDDLKGELVTYYNYDGKEMDYRYDIVVDADAAPKYRIDIKIEGESDSLNCTLGGDRLVCDGVDGFTFKRQ